MNFEFYIDDTGVRQAAKFVEEEFIKNFEKFANNFYSVYSDRVKKVVYRDKKQEWKSALTARYKTGRIHMKRIRQSMGFRIKIYHRYLKKTINTITSELSIGDFEQLNATRSKPYRNKTFPVWWIYEFGVGYYGVKKRPIIVVSRKYRRKGARIAMLFYWQKKWINTRKVIRLGPKTDLIGTVFGDLRHVPSHKYYIKQSTILADNKYITVTERFSRSLINMFRQASWFGGGHG